MRKRASQGLVLSKKTKCLGCHLVIEMVHTADADPVNGDWRRPRCGHDYPFAHWKIRKLASVRSRAA
jgi:hypothetical protein